MGYQINIKFIRVELTLPKKIYFKQLVEPCLEFSKLINEGITKENFIQYKRTGRDKDNFYFNNLTETGSITNWFKCKDEIVTLTGIGYTANVYSRNGINYFDNLKFMTMENKGNLLVIGSEGISTFINKGIEYYNFSGFRK